MEKDTYNKDREKGTVEHVANAYTGQKPLSLRGRLSKNPALKQANAHRADIQGVGLKQISPKGDADTPAQIGTQRTGVANPSVQQAGVGNTSAQQTGPTQEVPVHATQYIQPILQPARNASAAYVQTARAIDRKNDAASKLAEELADILEKETLLYSDASEISSKKTDIIVKGSIEDLESLVKAEQAIILGIGRLEDKREEIIMKLSEELDLELEGVNLSQITEKLGEESSKRLNYCQEDLMDTLTGLKNKNETNEQLIQNALDYIDFSVNLITTDQSGGINYSPIGEGENTAVRKNIFDVKL